jgi:hypothetical protein
LHTAVVVVGLFFPQRVKMGFDSRESTPGFKRQMIVTCSEARSFKRASLWLERVVGLKVSANTIERICLEVGEEMSAASEQDWQGVLDGQSIIPQVAVVAKLRTRFLFPPRAQRQRRIRIPIRQLVFSTAIMSLNSRKRQKPVKIRIVALLCPMHCQLERRKRSTACHTNRTAFIAR